MVLQNTENCTREYGAEDLMRVTATYRGLEQTPVGPLHQWNYLVIMANSGLWDEGKFFDAEKSMTSMSASIVCQRVADQYGAKQAYRHWSEELQATIVLWLKKRAYRPNIDSDPTFHEFAYKIEDENGIRDPRKVRSFHWPWAEGLSVETEEVFPYIVSAIIAAS